MTLLAFEVPNELKAELKILAVKQGKTIRDIGQELFQKYLNKQQNKKEEVLRHEKRK